MLPIFTVLIKLDTLIIGVFTTKVAEVRLLPSSCQPLENNRMCFHEILYWVRSSLKRIDKFHFSLKLDNLDAHYMKAYM